MLKPQRVGCLALEVVIEAIAQSLRVAPKLGKDHQGRSGKDVAQVSGFTPAAVHQNNVGRRPVALQLLARRCHGLSPGKDGWVVITW